MDAVAKRKESLNVPGIEPPRKVIVLTELLKGELIIFSLTVQIDWSLSFLLCRVS
jgi:hypothetical protein